MINKFKMERVNFPDHLAPDEIKNTEAFGLQMGKAIESEWFYRHLGGTSPFYDRRDKFHNLRLYSRGEQDTKMYKNLLFGDDDTNYVNLDLRPLQIIPKFVKLIVNQMSERLFDIKAEATDKYSTDLKDNYKKALQNYVIARPVMEEAKKQLGVDVFPDGYEDYPQSQEEIDLHMQLKYKSAIEIACEEALKFTLDLNDYSEVQSKVIEDVTVLGIGGVKHKTDLTKGIVVDYVDPAMLVHSYSTDRNFKKVYYYGEVERITINELNRQSGGKYTKDQLYEIAGQSADFYRYQNNTNEGSGLRREDLSGMMVDVMHFTFKSTNTISYKKKLYKNGGFGMTKRESTFDKKEGEEGFEVIKKVIDVWYEGTLILGTEKIYNYQLCENMVRPEGFLNITVPNYIMYAPELYQNRTKSLVERIISYVDEMQQIHIKIQQMIAKARPNGVYIDIDGLGEVDLGDGNFLSPLEVVKIYDETGNVLGTSSTYEGDYNYGRSPIQELKNGIIDGLPQLINSYNFYLNLLRDAIGVPQGADASNPHPDTLVGVQQQVALNSNTATRHILDASLNISQRLGQGLSLRLKDIFTYSDLKSVYTNAIGKLNVDVLEALKRYHLHDLGVTIELKPDFQEKQFLEQNIQNALAKGSINLDDAIDIRAIKNIKLANEVLKIRRVKKESAQKQHEKELATIQSQSQIQATQMAAQAKQAEIQTNTQSQLAIIAAKSQAKKEEINAEKAAKAELMEKEFEFNMTLQGFTDQAKLEMHKYKEDRTDLRQDKAKTQESAIADQKANNLPAQDFEKGKTVDQPQIVQPQGNVPQQSQDIPRFESSEDNINGGLDLSELEPH